MLQGGLKLKISALKIPKRKPPKEESSSSTDDERDDSSSDEAEKSSDASHKVDRYPRKNKEIAESIKPVVREEVPVLKLSEKKESPVKVKEDDEKEKRSGKVRDEKKEIKEVIIKIVKQPPIEEKLAKVVTEVKKENNRLRNKTDSKSDVKVTKTVTKQKGSTNNRVSDGSKVNSGKASKNSSPVKSAVEKLSAPSVQSGTSRLRSVRKKPATQEVTRTPTKVRNQLFCVTYF